MKRLDLQTATVDQLVAHFVELGIQQDDALLRNDTARVNRIFDQMEDVEHSLKIREGDQRRELLGLYEHPNMNVRVKAAKATLAVSPEAARRLLEAVRDSKWQPQALDAGMCLRALDRGIFKPT